MTAWSSAGPLPRRAPGSLSRSVVTPVTAAEPPDGPAEALLEAKLASLPASSGCYLFKDKAGEVVYVGKAKSLRSRVRSYFQESGSDNRYFIPILRKIVRDLETVVTSSEKEAAVLENDLIKQHQPRFNVKLRDDKDFLCLRLDPQKPWPRLETVRRPSADGARYFGQPYHSATSARRTLHPRQQALPGLTHLLRRRALLPAPAALPPVLRSSAAPGALR